MVLSNRKWVNLRQDGYVDLVNTRPTPNLPGGIECGRLSLLFVLVSLEELSPTHPVTSQISCYRPITSHPPPAPPHPTQPPLSNLRPRVPAPAPCFEMPS